ncbi:MAG: hypothetical protein IJU37_01265 [Desulfovibrio sp.]|nr:hypothetical protein [Desulfovibrio sp.]
MDTQAKISKFLDAMTLQKAHRRYLKFCTSVLPQAGLYYRNLYILERPHLCGGAIRSSMVLVLRRYKEGVPTLQDRVYTLHEALEKGLSLEEHFEYAHRAIQCVGPGYALSFIVEAYNKRPSMTAFMDKDGTVHMEPLYRMPTYESIRRAKSLSDMLWNWKISESPFQQYLDEPNLVAQYPNAADRLAFIVKREQAKSGKSYAELMSPFRQPS